jgi:hypothetical protein
VLDFEGPYARGGSGEALDHQERCPQQAIFSLTSFALTILKTVSSSPTRAIEYFQDDKNRAIRLLSGFH